MKIRNMENDCKIEEYEEPKIECCAGILQIERKFLKNLSRHGEGQALETRWNTFSLSFVQFFTLCKICKGDDQRSNQDMIWRKFQNKLPFHHLSMVNSCLILHKNVEDLSGYLVYCFIYKTNLKIFFSKKPLKNFIAINGFTTRSGK